jgi:hypothetical protein
MAAARPPDNPDVELSVFVTEDDLHALEHLAEELRLPLQRVLRDSITNNLLIYRLLSDGCSILYRTLDGVTGEIVF